MFYRMFRIIKDEAANSEEIFILQFITMSIYT